MTPAERYRLRYNSDPAFRAKELERGRRRWATDVDYRAQKHRTNMEWQRRRRAAVPKTDKERESARAYYRKRYATDAAFRAKERERTRQRLAQESRQ